MISNANRLTTTATILKFCVPMRRQSRPKRPVGLIARISTIGA